MRVANHCPKSTPNHCPECGSPRYTTYMILDPINPPLHFIQCEDCLYEIEPVETQEEAIKNWNSKRQVKQNEPLV